MRREGLRGGRWEGADATLLLRGYGAASWSGRQGSEAFEASRDFSVFRHMMNGVRPIPCLPLLPTPHRTPPSQPQAVSTLPAPIGK